jgi:hypothetical protein
MLLPKEPFEKMKKDVELHSIVKGGPTKDQEKVLQITEEKNPKTFKLAKSMVDVETAIPLKTDGEHMRVDMTNALDTDSLEGTSDIKKAFSDYRYLTRLRRNFLADYKRSVSRLDNAITDDTSVQFFRPELQRLTPEESKSVWDKSNSLLKDSAKNPDMGKKDPPTSLLGKVKRQYGVYAHGVAHLKKSHYTNPYEKFGMFWNPQKSEPSLYFKNQYNHLDIKPAQAKAHSKQTQDVRNVDGKVLDFRTKKMGQEFFSQITDGNRARGVVEDSSNDSAD